MSMRLRLVTLIFLLANAAILFAATSSTSDNSTTFIIVRHAEKALDAASAAFQSNEKSVVFDAKNPPLSALGLRHADALNQALENAQVYAVYATPFLRTQATAAPTAAAHGLKVSSYAATLPAAAFAEQLRVAAKPGTVVVVGHSNTVPAIVAALCGSRQTGKTTCLLALRDALNARGEYNAVYANIEAAQAFRNNVQPALETILDELGAMLERQIGPGLIRDIRASGASGNKITALLRMACERSEKPLIVFLDEVDALIGDTLISLLRQIRAGYTDRPKYFPHAMILCGVRDVRDYRMTTSDGEVITGGSAFNIKAESLRLGDFSRSDLVALYQQHTDATGQTFSEEAIELAWLSTQGQPWLVNALAEQAVFKTKENLDRTVAIDLERMRGAREALILRNDTHLDQLTDKLKEPRVRAVIEPMLIGLDVDQSATDLQYLRDLGLIRLDELKNPAPANAIYAEVLPRVLNATAQFNMHSDRIKSSWRNATGHLDPRQCT